MDLGLEGKVALVTAASRGLGAATALAFARMTDADSGSGRGLACARILQAMAAHPEMLAGTDRFCTDLARTAGPDVVGKAGAEGAYVSFLRRERQALLVKIEDGAGRAAQLATCNILERLGALSPSAAKALQEHLVTPFLSSKGDSIGSLRPSEALLQGDATVDAD